MPDDPCAMAASCYSVGLHVALALFTQLFSPTGDPAASSPCPRDAPLALLRMGAGGTQIAELGVAAPQVPSWLPDPRGTMTQLGPSQAWLDHP